VIGLLLRGDGVQAPFASRCLRSSIPCFTSGLSLRRTSRSSPISVLWALPRRVVQRASAASGLGLQNSGGGVGGRGEPCGFAAALGRRWCVAHNSTAPTATAKRGIHLTRKRSGLHLMNAFPWSRVSGPPLTSRRRDPARPRGVDECAVWNNTTVPESKKAKVWGRMRCSV
jgi:hypothetical protein